jgi:hypothetical protein
LDNGLLRTEKEDANLGEVCVGADDTWVRIDGVCNIFFFSMDAFANDVHLT